MGSDDWMNIIKFSHRKPTKILLSYLAGYFEGEGSISIVLHHSKSCKYRKGKAYVMYVSVGNTELDVLKIYCKFFGGTMWKERKSLKGNWKDIYRWKICSKKALYFLKNIKPFLRTKRKTSVCKLAIEFQKHKIGKFLSKKRGYPKNYFVFEDKLKEKITLLNKRGIL